MHKSPHSRTGLVLGLALSAAALPTFTGCGKDEVGPPENGAVTRTLDNLNGSSNLRSIAQNTATEATSTVAQSKKSEVTIKDEIVTSDGSRVRANPGQFYGHGYIVGSPISSADVGLIWPTYELHINQGFFPDDSSYIGSDVHLSVDARNSAIFAEFQAAERLSHQQYVFEYSQKNPFNPEIEGSKLFLQKVYNASDFLVHMNVDSLPKGIKARDPWQGSSGTKTKVGRIVDVERYGAMGDFGVLEINMSGLSSGGGEKLVRLTIMDEDIAVWCEKAMALGRDVEIQVSEDVVENWQPSSMFVTGIQFKEVASKTTYGISEKEYQAIRDRLLADPVFIQSISSHQK